MGKIYKGICKYEEGLCSLLFVVLVLLVFASAVARCFSIPIQWSIDVAQLIFAWLAFLGADVAMRHEALVGVGLVTRKFSPKVQGFLKIFCHVLIFVVLVVFVYNGSILSMESWKRSFQTLPISYSFVTLSLPVGSAFMILSTIHNIIRDCQVFKTVKE